MSAQQKLPQFIHGQPSMGLPFEKELVADLFAGGGGASTGHDGACQYVDQLERNADFLTAAKATSKRFGWRMVRWTAGVSALLVLFSY
ncbi:hypothetical protein [Pseudomonas sp. W2Jun17]|uniref:hypothetical protein n=1 Tax=Pseudomonas sp. W2Jun17 TaxID=1553460 RepID=UPI0020061224|nr:hypothetical protein [Pseudomonas sp. W2Jun17]MCK3851534.1 hypothetical protein [Pseudomonas sp. W2Jun17]